MTDVREPDPERTCTLFLELARIDSVSRSEKLIAGFVSDFFKDLGLACEEDDAGRETGGDCGNIVVRVPCRGAFPAEPLIFNAHLDTVEPGRGVVPVETDGWFSSAGDTVLGADDKAGVAAIMAAVETVSGSGCDHRALEVVLTVQEELGLAGARSLDFSMLEGVRAVVLDGSGDIGGIVVEAPTRWNMTFTVSGRSAHAGIEPECGVNAISCAASAISRLKIGRIDEETTSNIGVIEGGLAANIVPGRVVVVGEVRGLSGSRADEERALMRRTFEDTARECGCSVDVLEECSFSGFRIDTGSLHVRLITSAMEECGITPFFITSGGGSDANVFNARGIEAVNINMGFRNAHSEREIVSRADLIATARLLSAMATRKDVPGGAP